MLNELKKKYGNFEDSLVSSITYSRTIDDDGRIEVILNAMNAEEDFRFDKIKLIFSNIVKFRFIEWHSFSSLIINTVLIMKRENEVVFDFFPLITSDGLKENDESDFKIICKEVKYEFLQVAD